MVDGRHRSKCFRTRAEAERYRSLLLTAVHRGERFDPATGEPESWQPTVGDLSVYDWCRRWLGEQWTEWQPRTRDSAVETLTKVVMLTADAIPGPDAVVLRRHLMSSLRPDAVQPERVGEAWHDATHLR